MTEWTERAERGANVLRGKAVRIPLPDVDAERTLYENMRRIADAGDRKSELLADPDVPLTEAYEYELDEMRQSFEHRLQQVAGANYHDVATAYLDGERDDWVGELAVYYLDCYYRLQERYTVDDQVFVLVILRYPECFTVSLSFVTGVVTADGVRYESHEHAETGLDDRYRERHYADCQYSQLEAATYLRENVHHIRDAFPDPDETPFEDRQYGGFVHVTGRRGPVFSEVIQPVSPDPERFDTPPAEPGLVPEGPEVERVKRDFIGDTELVV